MGWVKGKKRTNEQKEKIGKTLKKYFSNPSMRKKLSESMKKYYSKQGVKERFSKKIKEYWHKHPDSYAKFIENSKKARSNPIFRKKMLEIKKKQYRENPKLIQKIDRAVTKWWKEHPHIKKERSIKIKNLFIKNPEKFEKFMKYGSNNKKPRLKTKSGFLVRSRGEQKIANFLFDNKIKSSYEKQTLIFEKEGQICVPDFYLPKFKMYIEFYGGHPKAWKKKVLKNRLYKKYKIPCIFITPAELRDLDYYLKRELG